MFELRPFEIEDSHTVAAWASSPEDAYEMNTSIDYPLKPEAVVAWRVESDYAFILCLDGDMVAYGDIVEDNVDNDVEIQRIIVAPDLRDQGIGKALLTRMCAFLTEGSSYPEVWFRVSRRNGPAASCARAVGFVDNAEHSGPRFLWMKRKLRPDELQ